MLDEIKEILVSEEEFSETNYERFKKAVLYRKKQFDRF